MEARSLKNESPHKSMVFFLDWLWLQDPIDGPMRSMANFVKYLSHEYRVYIICFVEESVPSKGEIYIYNQWVDWYGMAEVYYFKKKTNSRELASLLASLKFELIYINCLYRNRTLLIPIKALKINDWHQRIIVAPRGLTQVTKQKITALKKKLFIWSLRIRGLDKIISFHATDTHEKLDLLKLFGKDATVIHVPELTEAFQPEFKTIEKHSGELKIICIADIDRQNSIDFILRSLNQISASKNISLKIFGKIRDQVYFNQCQNLASKINPDIKVTFEDSIPFPELVSTITKFHLFFLPSRGDSYGYDLFNAFIAGRPLLSSNLIPWKALESEFAGWNLPLHNSNEFTKIIEDLANMSQEEYDRWAKGSYQFGKNMLTRILDKGRLDHLLKGYSSFFES